MKNSMFLTTALSLQVWSLDYIGTSDSGKWRSKSDYHRSFCTGCCIGKHTVWVPMQHTNSTYLHESIQVGSLPFLVFVKRWNSSTDTLQIRYHEISCSGIKCSFTFHATNLYHHIAYTCIHYLRNHSSIAILYIYAQTHKMLVNFCGGLHLNVIRI